MRIYSDVQQVWFGNFFRSIAISNAICPGFLANKPTQKEIDILRKMGWSINLKIIAYLKNNFNATIIYNEIDKIYFKANKILSSYDFNHSVSSDIIINIGDRIKTICLMNLKQYFYRTYDDKIIYRGTVMNRKDSCIFLKSFFETLSKYLLYNPSVFKDDFIHFCLEQHSLFLSSPINISDFVITSTIPGRLRLNNKFVLCGNPPTDKYHKLFNKPVDLSKNSVSYVYTHATNFKLHYEDVIDSSQIDIGKYSNKMKQLISHLSELFSPPFVCPVN